MGVGPMNLGGPGQKQGVHACGTPMNAASGSPLNKLEDLSGDGVVTRKDVLLGRGVLPKPKNK